MADVTTFYPGGAADAAVPHATDAVNATNATESDTIDDQNAATALYLWSGTQDQYNTIVTEYNADNSSHPNHLRTIYNVI